jgi:hypothetical protein
MKTKLRTSILFCAFACAFAVGAAETGTNNLQTTAKALDNLVAQKKVVYREIVKPGFKPVRQAVPPLDLKKISPVIASKLKVDAAEVQRLLSNDREKLSELVMARGLEAPTGKSWRELLATYEQHELVGMVEKHQVRAQVETKMDDLYTELSFAALDSMGSPPAGSDGKSDSGVKKK